MIRFLIIIIGLILAYLGLVAISKYDTILSVLIFDYRLDVSLFLVIVFFTLIISVAFLGLRIMGVIFHTPYMIVSRLAGYKKNNYTKLLLESYVNLVMGKADVAQKIVVKLDPKAGYSDFEEHTYFLAALCNKNSDQNMYLLQNLLSNKQYHDFAAKILAKRLFDQGFYQQSLSYAEHIRVETTTDPELLYLLLSLYAHLDMWEKFTVLTQRYRGAFPKKAEAAGKEIAAFYMKGAKYNLAQGEEAAAAGFLENSLEYDPLCIEAIEMLCNLNMSIGYSKKNLPILVAAFTAFPSFELFELYYKSTSIEPEEIYAIFSDLVDVRSYKDVFLAMAAYLKMFDKIDVLLSCEI